MKTKIINVLVIAILINCCHAPSYLPKSENLDVNPYGSYIIAYHIHGPKVKGELIAIDSASIVILEDHYSGKKKTVELQLKNVKSFTLTYAQPANYGWAILAYTLVTISHGFFAVISAPINLIVTISVTAGGSLSYQYSKKEMTFEKLKMFARFPQVGCAG